MSVQTRSFESLQALKQCVGEEVGVSDWVVIDQTRIDNFAQATNDFNWLHVDRQRAAAGPFGKTIAHGFLTLSLLPLFINDSIEVGNVQLSLNSGMDRVRFPAPVLVDSRVRGRVLLKAMDEIAPKGEARGYQIVFEVTVECEGETKPVCVAQNVHRKYG